MQTERIVAVAELKAHLSAELRRVQEGETTSIVDHRKPVVRGHQAWVRFPDMRAESSTRLSGKSLNP